MGVYVMGGGEGAVNYWLSLWTLELNTRMITADEVRQWETPDDVLYHV